MGTPFLHRVVVKNYKSIANCDVPLTQLTVLVGPNGSGKSNFLDALRFVSDALRNSLEYALRERGGINEVRRRSKGHPTHFGVRLGMHLPEGKNATFAFRIGALPAGAFSVQQELCEIDGGSSSNKPSSYRVVGGKLRESSLEMPSAIEPDRLYLGVVSALPEFRPLYDALTRMGFYNLNPDRLRGLQDPDPAEVLARDGGNITSILNRLKGGSDSVKARIEEYLGAVVPGVKTVNVKPLGPKETIEFRQEVPADPHPWRFLAASMSDGTLRGLGILVALFQGAMVGGKRVPFVGIEEPEIALHPAATSALADAILEATGTVQVAVTSHSPDLLDNKRILSENILAVVSDKGQTIIGPIDDASRQTLREGLFTPGELLRLQQIEPNKRAFTQPGRQFGLFDEQGPE